MIDNLMSMNYTLEEHFKDYSDKYEQVSEVYSLWILLKKDFSEKLNNVYRTFPYFSKHDVSHSRTIITNIELFLGEQRIKMLSATDTFMLLICAYSHDIGMALELEETLNILEDNDGVFKDFLIKNHINKDSANRLKRYYDKKESDGDLKELYHSIILILQEYKRLDHWKGVERIESDFNALFVGRIKGRFIKSIINICKMHGKDVNDISTLSIYSTGMFADLFHPRFIAAMIRLGDLLDLDNNRFNKEFFESISKNSKNIPDISKMHYLKHESITHFFIGPNHIDVEASCSGNDGLNVARELYEWLHWLENDCDYYKSEWDMIAPRNFGVAPRLRTKKILVDGTEYQHFVYNLKMELPHDRIFNLLAGSNVYDSRYAAFREIIQNAVDATLLQLWNDFYNSLSPEQQDNMILDDYLTRAFASKCLSEKFINDYKIHVDVIENTKENTVYVEIIDQGIGIDDDDLLYMSRIGENSICNPQKHHLIETMPDWLIPSGVFGIGLQSAFQLSDEIEFYTKKANRTPRHIRFSSYSSNKGKIEVSKCPNTYEKEFKRLSTQGTLVRIKINQNIFNGKDNFDYFDLDFEHTHINAHVIRVEIIHQLNKYFADNQKNYFPVTFSSYAIDENGGKKYGNGKKIKNKMWYNKDFYEVINTDEKYVISNNKKKYIGLNEKIASKKIRYFNKKKNIFLTLDLPSCILMDEINNIVSLRLLSECFSLSFKYNKILDYRQLFNDNSTDPNKNNINLDKNLFKCSVVILDKNTEVYLNIDRNVLKSNSITYKDIVQIESELFTKVYEDMINNTTKTSALFSKDYLPLLTILFARFINRSKLQEFINKYMDELKKYSIKTVYNDSNIPLLEFIGVENAIQINLNNNDNKQESQNNYEDFFEEFPEWIFVPTEIYYNADDNYRIYKCKIKNELESENTIIDEECWNQDCNLLYTYGLTEFIKTALKPLEKYETIIVNQLPKTFRKSKSFSNKLDDNISKFILSPFDEITIKTLNKNIKNQKALDNDSIVKSFENNSHFIKCIKYVSYVKKTVSEEAIKETYYKMISDMSKALMENKQTIE